MELKWCKKKILEAEKMNLIGVSLEEYANTLKDILQRIERLENTLID